MILSIKTGISRSLLNFFFCSGLWLRRGSKVWIAGTKAIFSLWLIPSALVIPILPVITVTTDSKLHVVGDLQVVGRTECRVQQCCVVSKPHCQHSLSVTADHPPAVWQHSHCCHCCLVTLFDKRTGGTLKNILEEMIYLVYASMLYYLNTWCTSLINKSPACSWGVTPRPSHWYPQTSLFA